MLIQEPSGEMTRSEGTCSEPGETRMEVDICDARPPERYFSEEEGREEERGGGRTRIYKPPSPMFKMNDR